jgi:LuxR family maltose regulon positive regulatory protein
LSDAATAITGPAGVATYAMGQLAVLEATEGRWIQAERISHQAIEEIERLGLENLVSSGAAYVMYAAAAAHRGDTAIARRRLQGLNALLPSLSTAMPFDAFQIHLLTAETNAAIGEQRAAAVHVEAAERHQELLTDAGVFEGRLAALIIEESPEAGTTRSPGTSPTLTDRELDVLTLLPTALSLREVGDHLYVSRDTVKTYVTRIYRKLGVSSRSAAITRATDLGLLERP